MLPIETKGEFCAFTPERIHDICVFCDEFDVSRGTELFYELFPQLIGEKHVLEETPQHVLLPDIAPLTQDHLLVASKKHVPSFASLPAEYHRDYQSLVNSVILRMSNLHPKEEPLTFEHGVGSVNGKFIRCGGCGRTDHAHLHVLPVSKDSHRDLISNLSLHVKLELGFEEHSLTDPFDLSELGNVVAGHPYLMIGNRHEGNVYIQNDTNEIPSQYIRAFLGGYLGIAEHNWKLLLAESPQLTEGRIRKTLADWG